MAEPLVDVDLDALAPAPKRVKLRGKVYKLPADMPMQLFFRLQSFDQRSKAGEEDTVLLSEIHDELLALFQEHQPTLEKLPAMGVLELTQALPRIYGGAVGEPPPNRTTRRQKKRTPSKPAPRAKRPTSA